MGVVCNLSAQKVKGSDTVLPLSQREAEVFAQKYPQSNLVITGGGSGVGIAALISGTTDIAMASRKIKFDEVVKIQEAGQGFSEVVIAWDALAVVVHPANKVSQLTREQIEGIFTGKITNWNEVGGDNLKIVPYGRESSSGTFEFFKESVLKNKNYMSGIMSMPATGAIIQSVSQTEGAIGYVGFAYVNDRVRALKVSYDSGKNYIAPSLQTAMNKTYPIVRPLYFYVNKSVQRMAQPFVDFILSSEGQTIVKDMGYVPLH